MKPEVVSAQEPVLITQEEYELSEDEEVLINILKDNSPIDLNELKEQSHKGTKQKQTRKGGKNRCRLDGFAGIAYPNMI